MKDEIISVKGKLYFPFYIQGCPGCVFYNESKKIGIKEALIVCNRDVYDDNGNAIKCNSSFQWRVCIETEINY